MSMITHSKVRRRSYKRKFDHDLCRELHAKGIYSKAQLAKYFGVSVTSIERITDPRREKRMTEYGKRWQREHLQELYARRRTNACLDCGAPIRDISVRCNTCDKRHAMLPTFNEEGLLYCGACKAYHDPSAFSADFSKPHRGCLRLNCRDTESAYRRELRRRTENAIHLNNAGSPACNHQRIVKPRLSDDISKVTCKYCLKFGS